MNESHRFALTSRLKFFLTGLLLLLQACSGHDAPSERKHPADGRDGGAVASILVSSPTERLGQEMTVQLSASALNKAGDPLSGISFAWESSDADVLSINPSTGIATGVSPGNAAITAVAHGIRSAPVELIVAPRSTISGTAAVGAALADAQVVLKDISGKTASTRTAADGTFSVTTTMMSPPFMLRVTSADQETIIYSASDTTEADGVINATPLTDLIVRSWFTLNERSIDAGFESDRDSWPAPVSVTLIGNVLKSPLAIWLERAGIDSNSFSPISTPFVADGTGADRILDLLTISGPEKATLSEEGIVHHITLTHDTSQARVVATSLIESSEGTSGAVFSTFVPLSSEEQTALQFISEQVTKLGETIRERHIGLTADDLLPFLRANFLHDGLDRATYAAALATSERGKSAQCRLSQLSDRTVAPLVLEVLMRCTSATDGAAQTTERRLWFSKDESDDWRAEGNQRLARLSISTELRNMQGAAAAQGTFIAVSASALAPAGRLLEAVVHGPGTTSDGLALLPRSAAALQLEPLPDSVLTIERERFLARIAASASGIDSLDYEFHLTSSAGEKGRHTVQPGYTTEAVSITNLDGTSLSHARLGEPLQVDWTIPDTFAIENVQIEARTFTSGDQGKTAPDCVTTAPPLAPPTATGTITIPARCNGLQPARIELRVIVTGIAGERSVAIYEFQRSASEFIPTSTDLPIVRIVTENEVPVVSKEEYVRATLTIDPNGTGETAATAPLRVRGRGNSTWGMPKKPYKLKLDSKASLLGMPADKDWVLLANYADKTLLRNRVAFELGNRVGLAWSPRMRFVELFINDEYLGTYQLGEGVKVGKDRVAIPELEEDDVSPSEVTGGYLLEVDTRLDGEVFFVTDRNVPFVLDTPEAPVTEQFTFIQNYVQQAEDAIYSPDFADPSVGYAAYIDVDSFINWYLVNEIMKNNDAIFFSSCWMYKQRDDKLFMGPLWDFDIGAGNVNYNGNDDPTGWWIRHSPWFGRLFDDPAFQARLKARWNELKAEQIDTILDYIEDSAASLTQSASNNFQRWPILDQWVWPNAVVTGSYEGEVQYLREWLQTRIAWMDAQINP